ncbi:type VI secretion system-associated FHA domain protein TagH [Antarcticimicrobium luteum]|uniref:Type VI secretion system-associated FHA domain protein TagH n=1 Tax=Antarcticimicrobium luteum TaxID=2547397 RepID=A0A4R5V4Y1_9RHOB|nr:type VI secretion system-associated FHA domain protein TagH [Antarcticimicrobium luteum]TDK46864.1 type VI secretion system-associated FHA domain protein TagH [Antarcticimicrobium luteum]
MGVTLKFQSSGTIPGNARPVRMQGGSLTVGRGPANDMVLPDPDRILSKNHFVIEDHNGNVMVVDLSTNGTFLNYAKIPLGRTPTPLNDGDVLCLGPYELVVEIGADLPADTPIAAPAAEGPASHGIAENAPDPLSLLDDAGPGGDFLDDLLGGADAPTGPSQLNPADPIDELMPPLDEDDDPFFAKPDDGRGGEGASLPAHNPSASDSFAPQTPSPFQSPSQSMIPEDWDDDLLGGGTDAAPSAPAPIPPAPVPTPSAPPQPTPMAPPEVTHRTPPNLDPDAGPPDFLSPDAAAPEQPPQLATSTSPATPPATPQAAPPATPQGEATVEDSGTDAARAFLEGIGATEVKLDDEELVTAMGRMGRVMKTLITGLREILMTRTSIKSEFRIEQTMIGAGGNNPLKFSISPEQAIEAMVRPAVKGYLSPETAAEQALDDIKAHEIAMVTGMEAALKGVLTRLDPKEVAGRIETSGAFGSLLKGKKARYWEVYEKLYADISDEAENDFHDLFSREFARAYQNQMNKLKP